MEEQPPDDPNRPPVAEREPNRPPVAEPEPSSPPVAEPEPSSLPVARREPGSPPVPRRASVAVRVLASMAVLALAGTYLAAQIDFVRRHTLGFPPLDVRRYWVLQIKFIWVRGLGGALLLALAAFVLHRRRQAD